MFYERHGENGKFHRSQSFPTMANRRTASNATGRECSCVAKTTVTRWGMAAASTGTARKWKSGREGFRLPSHEEVNGRPSQCETCRLEELRPFLTEEESTSLEIYTQGSWHLPCLFALWAGAGSFCYAGAFILATVWWIIQCCNPIERQRETHGMWHKTRHEGEKEKLWVCVLCVDGF